jgi:hypothetical protein
MNKFNIDDLNLGTCGGIERYKLALEHKKRLEWLNSQQGLRLEVSEQIGPSGLWIGNNYFTASHLIDLLQIIRYERAKIRDETPLWVIDKTYVCEPSIEGDQLGELPDYDVAGKKLIHFTQEEHDRMAEEYKAEHGHYPGDC